jgi:predicted DCC family thiol-disulfide oxidoreductase YuxK
VIEFSDINLEPDVLSRFGARVRDVRRRLHAVHAEGRLQLGADCAIAIWLRPRGRIVFDRSRDLFIIYADRKLLTPVTIARLKRPSILR